MRPKKETRTAQTSQVTFKVDMCAHGEEEEEEEEKSDEPKEDGMQHMLSMEARARYMTQCRACTYRETRRVR